MSPESGGGPGEGGCGGAGDGCHARCGGWWGGSAGGGNVGRGSEEQGFSGGLVCALVAPHGFRSGLGKGDPAEDGVACSSRAAVWRVDPYSAPRAAVDELGALAVVRSKYCLEQVCGVMFSGLRAECEVVDPGVELILGLIPYPLVVFRLEESGPAPFGVMFLYVGVRRLQPMVRCTLPVLVVLGSARLACNLNSMVWSRSLPLHLGAEEEHLVVQDVTFPAWLDVDIMIQRTWGVRWNAKVMTVDGFLGSVQRRFAVRSYDSVNSSSEIVVPTVGNAEVRGGYPVATDLADLWPAPAHCVATARLNAAEKLAMAAGLDSSASAPSAGHYPRSLPFAVVDARSWFPGANVRALRIDEETRLIGSEHATAVIGMACGIVLHRLSMVADLHRTWNQCGATKFYLVMGDCCSCMLVVRPPSHLAGGGDASPLPGE